MIRNILLKEFFKNGFIKVTNTVSVAQTNLWPKQREGKERVFAALGTDLAGAAAPTPRQAAAGGQALAWAEAGLRGWPVREASHTRGTRESPRGRSTPSPGQRRCLARSVHKESE